MTDFPSCTFPEAFSTELAAVLEQLDADRVVERLWARDHTLWRPDPEEISNRLGWLDLARNAPNADEELETWAAGARSRFQDVVLLGMGGSSLGAEAMNLSWGPREGAPRLHVLDSTHPSAVRAVREKIDPATTVFLVASKSGTTAEVMAFFRYFWGETEAVVGEAVGRHFVAITDPDSPLAHLAEEQNFAHCFLNPSDIGGRFSVLSRFGMVSAEASGIPSQKLLESAHRVASESLQGPAATNSAAWLGAVLGTAARSGRPLLTLLAAEKIRAFGLWAEQLIAESTGKEGTGVVPIAEEPMGDVSLYGDDRIFVALHLETHPDAALEKHCASIRDAGLPLVELRLGELADLGGEFFRWEAATAVAGRLLGIQPFDQPDVQSTKTATRRALDALRSSGTLPEIEIADDLAAALADGDSPRYVALMAYVAPSAEFDAAIADLRRDLLARGLCTTFGYGPRFLHSTGQLHKGGPAGGLFVQLTAQNDADLTIPGESLGFGPLVRAQAAGDLDALASRRRRCVRIDLGDDPVAALRDLTAGLS